MSSDISIKLTAPEMILAGQIGVLRMVHVITKGRNHTYGSKDSDNWQRHIEGAMGECAVAKYLGLFWNGTIGEINRSDVGKIEVRTAFDHNRRLILHKEDKDDSLFVFVTGGNGVYLIRGWIKCSDGKQDRYWSDPTKENRPAYFVPTTILKSMNEFPSR